MTGSDKQIQVVMPKLGLTMIEATVVEWHKGDGDWVERGDPLFTIETEKVTLEIEAPESGVLHILVPAGEKVPVLELVAMLAAPDLRSVDSEFVDSEALSSTPRHGQRVSATPKARTLARRRGLSLEGVAGTGPRGMIVAVDLERAVPPKLVASPVARRVAAEAGLDLSAVPGTGPGGRIMRHDVDHALLGSSAPADLFRHEPEAQAAAAVAPLSGLRAVIAERLSASWRERPHVTLTTEADAANLVSARQQAITELNDKVSYDAFFVKLVAQALLEHPHVNVRLTPSASSALGGAGIEKLDVINVGVAVDTERGLLVPVVRDAPSKSLVEIQQELRLLAERASVGRSLPDDLSGGTFTITNLGMYEIDAFTPIINPPESGILGVGRIVAKPVALGGQVVVRDTVTLSLSFDHRLIDGAPAARFLQRVKQLVERPFALALLG